MVAGGMRLNDTALPLVTLQQQREAVELHTDQGVERQRADVEEGVAETNSTMNFLFFFSLFLYKPSN